VGRSEYSFDARLAQGLYRIQMKIPAAMAAINASPPITPPTIGPVGGELLDGVVVPVKGTGVVVVFETVSDELDGSVLVIVLVVDADN
jgi:hypothetical protein